MSNRQTLAAFAALFVGYLALASIATWPALRGYPVGDDRAYLSEGSGAVRIDYQNLFWPGASETPRKYRPLSDLSLYVAAGLPNAIRIDRGVGAGLAALLAWLVAVVIVRAGRPLALGAAAGALFVVHPGLVELPLLARSRAELLAAVFLALLALATPTGSDRRQRPLVALLVALLGALTHELFAVGALVVALRPALAADSPADGRKRAFALAGIVLVAVLGLRAAATRELVPDVLTGDLLVMLRRTPRTVLEIVATVVLPWNRAPRTLAYALGQPMSAPAFVAALALGLLVVHAGARERRTLGLAIFAGMLLAFWSTLEADVFRVGMDHLVLLPLLLVVLTASESATDFPAVTGVVRPLVLVSFGLAGAALAHLGARSYAGDRVAARAMNRERPTDPSGLLYEARIEQRAGHPFDAKRLVERTPVTTITTIERYRATLYVSSVAFASAAESIEAAALARPDDALLAADSIVMDIGRGRFSDLPRLAELAATRAESRRLACVALERRRSHSGLASEENARLYGSALRELHCGASPAP